MSGQTFPSVTVMFTDVVGFTTICAKISPIDVVDFLNMMYSTFDELVAEHNVYKAR